MRPLPQFGLALELNARPLARGNIRPGQAASPTRGRGAQRPQKIMALAGEVGVFQHGAGRDDARNSPFDQPLGSFWVFCLVADGDVVALVDELGHVALHRMPRYAAHGDGVFCIPAAAGEGNLKLAGRDLGVFKKQFIKVAHAVKQQGIGVFGLDAHVLLKHGGQFYGGFRHSNSWGDGDSCGLPQP